MAVIPAVYTLAFTGHEDRKASSPGAYVITWTDVSENDTCETVYHPDYSEKSIDLEISGTTPIFKIMGGNDPAGLNGKQMKDLLGNDMSYSADAIAGVLTNTQFIKPEVTSGTSIVATLRLLITTITRR